jgi:hypothetical protein
MLMIRLLDILENLLVAQDIVTLQQSHTVVVRHGNCLDCRVWRFDGKAPIPEDGEVCGNSWRIEVLGSWVERANEASSPRVLW